MSLIPDKTKKSQQHNFKTEPEARLFLRCSGYTCEGYLTEEPWASFFVEKWTRPNHVALIMNITCFWMTLPIQALNEPWQVDIADLD